jgi:hypothetical protein
MNALIGAGIGIGILFGVLAVICALILVEEWQDGAGLIVGLVLCAGAVGAVLGSLA